jgi:hypothetical protein
MMTEAQASVVPGTLTTAICSGLFVHRGPARFHGRASNPQRPNVAGDSAVLAEECISEASMTQPRKPAGSLATVQTYQRFAPTPNVG